MRDIEADRQFVRLNGEISVADRSRGHSSKPLRDTSRSTFSIQLEFLDRCDFNCPGCFVKRKNTYTEHDLDVLNNLAEQFSDRGFEMNEVILGPTDLFGCRNAEEIISEPKFATLFKHFHALTFPTTLGSDYEHIKKIVDLMHEKLPDHIYYEVFVVFDMSRYNANDEEYIERFERNLALLKDANIIFAFNIHDTAFDQIGYERVSKDVNERYNSHLKMVPSFFRSPNDLKIRSALRWWKDYMNRVIVEEQATAVLNNMADWHFGGYTYLTYTYKAGQLYANPFIYDFVFDPNDAFAIPQKDDGYYDIDSVFEWERGNIVDQFAFAETVDCSSCVHLPSCVGKNVLTYMDAHNIKKCFLPKDAMAYQTNT